MCVWRERYSRIVLRSIRSIWPYLTASLWRDRERERECESAFNSHSRMVRRSIWPFLTASRWRESQTQRNMEGGVGGTVPSERPCLEKRSRLPDVLSRHMVGWWGLVTVRGLNQSFGFCVC